MIARHCRSVSGHMRRGEKRARYDLFLPKPYKELSVVRCSGIDDAAVRAIGVEHIGDPLKGHATVAADVVFARSLQFDADGEPFARHANIVGWPEANEPKYRLDAKALADASTLVEY
jgi:hypothetical protein